MFIAAADATNARSRRSGSRFAGQTAANEQQMNLRKLPDLVRAEDGQCVPFSAKNFGSVETSALSDFRHNGWDSDRNT